MIARKYILYTEIIYGKDIQKSYKHILYIPDESKQEKNIRKGYKDNLVKVMRKGYKGTLLYGVKRRSECNHDLNY